MSLLIRNVKVLGGPQGLPEKSDVFISGETISAIGSFPHKSADETIDGQGGYLSPGFIDTDATSDHYLTIFSDPEQEDFLKQGVTTIIGGQCGASLAPLLYGSLESIRSWGDPSKLNIDWHTVGEFLKTLDKRPLGINFGTFAGHSTIRRAMIGEEVRDLTKNEIKVFEGVLARALEEGAFGLSFGLEYFHTRGTPFEELKTFAEMTAKAGASLSIHLRHTGENIDAAMAEAVRLYSETGAAILVPHFVPLIGHETAYEKALATLDGVPAEANIHAAVYPFAGVVEAIYRMLPEWAQNGELPLMQKSIEDKWLAKRIVGDLPDLAPEAIMVEAARNPSLVGKSLGEFMEISGVADPKAAFFELMRATKLQAVVSWQTVNEAVLQKAVKHPRILIGSHSAALKTPAPVDGFRSRRSRETFTSYLADAEAREDLPAAILKMCKIPALKFNLKGRGEIKEGNLADLAIFRGGEVKHTVVAGKLAVRDGAPTGILSGKPIRFKNT